MVTYIQHITKCILPITITLENPQLHRVTFADGHITEYLYDATGEKRQTKYLVDNRTVFAAMALGETESDEVMDASDSTAIETLLTRDYCGDYIYEDRELERIMTINGYYSGSSYAYFVRDDQGNVVKLNFGNMSANWSQYYPYGGLFPDYTINRYLYSGKELDKTNGLYLYDFHARHYDPMLARFTTIDPLCEKYYPISPYAYCACNPVKYIDPTGMETRGFFSETDSILTHSVAVYPKNEDIQIFAHGNKNGIFPIINNKKVKISTTSDLIKFINKTFETGKNVTAKSVVTIVLHSCMTGSGDGSFAEKISTDMPNATIIAPNGYVLANFIGEVGVFKGKTSSSKNGVWRVFQKGKEVNTLSSKTKPNGNPGPSLAEKISNWWNNLFK